MMNGFQFNWLHWTLAGLAAIFVLLLLIRPRIASSYLRYTVLFLVATLILMPFVWLVCSSFKDKDVLNESMFLPPPLARSAADGKLHLNWSSQNINLGNFRTLFQPQASLQGPVSFWSYAIN